LKGRIYRQGQTRDTVKMVIPLTYATVNSQRWSWCDSKMQRLKFKSRSRMLLLMALYQKDTCDPLLKLTKMRSAG
jgi:hypothetical protein